MSCRLEHPVETMKETAATQLKKSEAWSAIQRQVKAAKSRKLGRNFEEELFFGRLQISRRIKERDRKRVVAALETGDWKFFEHLARILKKPVRSPFKKLTPAELFLKENWHQYHGLTEPKLFDKARLWCRAHALHPDAISHDSLKKARQRLGLWK
jgi:hypothetical protein